MKSPTTSKNNRGFTIIEMLIVVGLISIIGGLGLYLGFDSLRGYSFRSDRDVLVSTLQHARAEAIANVCRGDSSVCSDGKPHGVKILSDKFVIFQGTSYATRDSAYDADIDFNHSTIFPSDGSLTEAVFNRLSGDVDTPGFITLNDSGTHESKIEINSEGQILWSN